MHHHLMRIPMHNSMPNQNLDRPDARRVRPRASGSLAGLLALSLIATGCESNGSGGGTSTNHENGPALATPPVAYDAWAKIGYRLDWQAFASVPRGNRVIQFEVAPDVLVIQENGSRVTLLEKSDGSMRWTNELANRLTKYVGADVVGDRVLVSSDSELTGLDIATGNVVLRQRFQRVVNTPPAIFGGIAVYGSASGEVMGHLLSAGAKLWGFQTPGAIEHGAVNVNGIAGIVSQSGDVLFMDPQSGVLYGRQRMFKGIENEPVAGDGAMFVAGLDQSIYAFEPSGRVRWRYRTEFALTSQPTFHDGAVYCEIPTMGLVSLDAGSGARRWASPDAHGTVVAQRNGMLVVFGGRQVMLVDPVDGTIVASEAIPDVAMLVPEEFSDGAIYAVSGSGTVSRLIPRR